MARWVVSSIFASVLVWLSTLSAAAQTDYQLLLLNQAGEEVTAQVDGNLLRVTVDAGAPVAASTTLSLYLDQETNYLGDCQIPTGEQRCVSAPIVTLGWYWGDDETIRPRREVYAVHNADTERSPVASIEVTVHPRPVVLVHGFTSSYAAWLDYLGPAGYLARTGVPGFAVGDGQAPGVMLTGNIFRPAQKTNTIAKNAEILGDYLAHVKAETGAEQVDLVVHSMGGLISRFYIDRYMTQRDVAQLIMLGTPNGGSDCAVLPGTLGFYQPAALELRASYLRDVFNPQILDTGGVPFYMIAGVPIQRRILSPCGEVPNDMVVSLASALTIPAELAEVPLLHTDLNASEAIYLEFVAPLLRKSPQDFTQGQTLDAEPDTPDPGLLQFSQTLTGAVTANSASRQTIHIDRDVAVASFGLFDPTRSLTVTVQGASGNQIDLNPDDHGLAVITDPEVLLYLGYGFENPRPGPWVVTVHATERTPPTGADYALFTLYSGGADIRATLSNHLPSIESQVQLTATLQLGGEPVVFDQAEVVVHHPDGRPQYISIAGGEEVLLATVQPPLPGVYGIDVSMSSTLDDGTVLARTAYLAFEAFITPPGGRD